MKGHFYTKGGLVEVELELDKKFGGYIRPGSSDQDMLKDCLKKDYSSVECKDHIVLDLGSNIGGFILKAAREKAKEIVCYEPEPYNFVVLRENALLASEGSNLIPELHQAAVAKEAGTFDLVINPGKNSACSASLTTRVQSNKISVPVQVEAFSDVLAKVKPTMIKMDIEGAEYGILDLLDDADTVKELAIELHGFSLDNRALMHQYFNKFKDTWTLVSFKEHIVFKQLSLITAHFTK